MQTTNAKLEDAPAHRGRVLVVDDHPAMRDVLRALLEEVGGWEVVGEAGSGEEAVPMVARLTPDVVLMDCKMPGRGGVAATREIVQRWPRIAVVAHTAYADEAYVREMVAAGARGYVLKGDSPSTILEALAVARHGGARLSAAVSGPVLDDVRGLYAAALARSERLEAENASLNAAVAHLEQVDRLKDQFLAMVSHELRTPLTVILGNARTLERHPELAATPPGQEILAGVVRQTQRLCALVEQLLQASAFTANRSPALRADPIDAAAVAREVVAARRDAGTTVDVRLDLPSQPSPLAADADALRAVIDHLLDNACRHAPPGTDVELRLRQQPGWARIEVADRGSAVPAEERERVFDPFIHPGEVPGTAGGIGIGLFLVDRLARGMGGRVWVEQNPGGGTRFIVELPDSEPYVPA